MLLPSGNDITEESPVLVFAENDGDDESLSQSAGECYSPNPDYAIGVQSCSQLRCHRKETFTWMLNICRTLRCPNCVAYYGINYFDRYLSAVPMDKKQLSLLSWVCLHLASAHFDTLSNRLSFRDLCSVMRDSYSSNEIHHYIVRVLSVLKFRLLCPNPFIIAYQLLEKVHLSSLYAYVDRILILICGQYESLSVSVLSIVNFAIGVSWFMINQLESLPPALLFVSKLLPSDVGKLVSIVDKSNESGLMMACKRFYNNGSLKEEEHSSSPVCTVFI